MDNAVVSGIAHASRAQTDTRDLASLGYKQEFQRDFGGFSNFALSFSVISILTGAITLCDYGLSMGGPRQMTLGWPLATVGTLLITLSMAELCSAFPTSGGMIHWSATLAGPTWAWFTAWLNIVGLVTVIAGIDYGCALFLLPMLGLPSESPYLLITYVLLLLSQTLINHYSTRSVAWLNGACPHGRRCSTDWRPSDFCSQAAASLSSPGKFFQRHSRPLCLAFSARPSASAVDLHGI
jgi:Amino acid permease